MWEREGCSADSGGAAYITRWLHKEFPVKSSLNSYRSFACCTLLLTVCGFHNNINFQRRDFDQFTTRFHFIDVFRRLFPSFHLFLGNSVSERSRVSSLTSFYLLCFCSGGDECRNCHGADAKEAEAWGDSDDDQRLHLHHHLPTQQPGQKRASQGGHSSQTLLDQTGTELVLLEPPAADSGLKE